ncbi:MAG: type II secretion system protein GspM [Pseudomonadota bacterium]
MSIKSWYASQSAREQFIVASTAIIGVVAGLYLFVIEPLNEGIAARTASVESQKKNLAWMQQQSGIVKRSGSSTSGAVTRQPMPQAPYLLLDAAIRDKKIAEPERVTPDGTTGARAQISNVEFDKLLEVLGGLDSRYGLAVTTMNVSKKNEGLVTARFSLEVEQ